jgi:hypothetical protein
MGGFWYYAEGDKTRGPVAFDQLIKLLSQLPALEERLSGARALPIGRLQKMSARSLRS